MSDLVSSSIDSINSNSTYNTSASTKTLENSLSSTDLSTASDDKLLSVCKDFESYFVEQVFKGMQKMVPKNEDDKTSSSSSSLTDYYKDELTSKYATSASESNGGEGLGIAKILYEQMKRNYGTTE